MSYSVKFRVSTRTEFRPEGGYTTTKTNAAKLLSGSYVIVPSDAEITDVTPLPNGTVVRLGRVNYFRHDGIWSYTSDVGGVVTGSSDDTVRAYLERGGTVVFQPGAEGESDRFTFDVSFVSDTDPREWRVSSLSDGQGNATGRLLQGGDGLWIPQTGLNVAELISTPDASFPDGTVIRDEAYPPGLYVRHGEGQWSYTNDRGAMIETNDDDATLRELLDSDPDAVRVVFQPSEA